MIPLSIFEKYHVEKIRVKHMGKNRADRKIVSYAWNPEMSRRDFLNEFEEADRKGCGLFLCGVEFNEFCSDRWWDIPDYRDEAIRDYRGRIRAIRSKYGLSKSDVSSFMSV